jgi:hypothetical protein
MTNNSNLSPVAQYDFTLTAALANSAGSWLNINIPDLSLTNGEWYSFQIYAIESNSSQRLFLEMSTNSVYAGNYEFAQAAADHAYTGTLSSTANDLTFYTTSVPEPSQFAMLAGLLVSGLAMFRRQGRR